MIIAFMSIKVIFKLYFEQDKTLYALAGAGSYNGRQWCGTATAEWDSFQNHFTTVRMLHK